MFFYLSSYKVQKVDGYKLKSTNWTDHPKRMKILTVQKVGGYKLKSTKWTDHPKMMKILTKSKKWTGIN